MVTRFDDFFSLRNFEKGAFAMGGGLRKFVASCAPNLREIASISFRTSDEGCAKLSQIRKSISENFMRIPLFQCPLLQISDYLGCFLLFRASIVRVARRMLTSSLRQASHTGRRGRSFHERWVVLLGLNSTFPKGGLAKGGFATMIS